MHSQRFHFKSGKCSIIEAYRYNFAANFIILMRRKVKHYFGWSANGFYGYEKSVKSFAIVKAIMTKCAQLSPDVRDGIAWS